jgi:RNA polymerase sigma-70 factor (ECF subfamily)
MQITSATMPATGAAAERTRSADEVLIASIATSDKRAMERLFERHNRWIYHFLYHLTGSASLAEEMLTEVFLTVWHEAKRFETKSSVSTWLLAIARQRAIEKLRYLEAQGSDSSGRLPAITS